MTDPTDPGQLPDDHLHRLNRRCRLLLLLDAAEKAGVAPLPSARFHALAYLADVLSPVWDLDPFDGKVYKSDGGPRYPDLQREIDALVVLGLVQVSDLSYEATADAGARVVGHYALNFDSPHLGPILDALGAGSPDTAVVPADVDAHAYLRELASAMSTLPDDQIESATAVDATYGLGAQPHDVVDFAEWVQDRWQANPTWRTAERFKDFLPAESKLLSGEKLYLYAAYLGRAMND